MLFILTGLVDELEDSFVPYWQSEVHGGYHGKASSGDHGHEDGGEELESWLVKEAEASGRKKNLKNHVVFQSN